MLPKTFPRSARQLYVPYIFCVSEGFESKSTGLCLSKVNKVIGRNCPQIQIDSIVGLLGPAFRSLLARASFHFHALAPRAWKECFVRVSPLSTTQKVASFVFPISVHRDRFENYTLVNYCFKKWEFFYDYKPCWGDPMCYRHIYYQRSNKGAFRLAQ